MPSKLNNSSLRQARAARQLSLAEVASFTKISGNSLTRFEAGDAEPSFTQLTKLSELYNVALYAFYGEKPPELEVTLPDFRKTHPTAANLSPRGLSRLWQIERNSLFVEELVRALGRDAPEISSLKRLTNKAVPDPTELRIGFDKWLSARRRLPKFAGDKEGVFLRYVRLFLDSAGCTSSFNTAPTEDYLGFFKEFSPRSRVIFVNRDVKQPKRRLFTFAHEIAHLVYDEEGVSDPFVARNEIEKRCNAYAAHFLAPDEMVWSILGSAQAPGGKDVPRLVSFISRYTLLSRQASALRLEELGVISKKEASSFFTHLRSLTRIVEVEPDRQEKKPMGRAAAVGKKLSEVGVYAAYVTWVAFKKKIIDVVDIERGLGISEKMQASVLDLACKRFEASVD